MNCALMFVLVFSLASTGLQKAASETSPQATTARARHLVHIEIINMSGQSREARIGNAVIPLPVAQRVALQVPTGRAIRIMSNTNRNLLRVITVSVFDEGRLFPVV